MIEEATPWKASDEKPVIENPKQDLWLSRLEVFMVFAVAIGSLIISTYLLIWILSGWHEDWHQRLARTVRGINNNWRIDLLILVPLLFRPIRRFLVNLREGPFGTKSGHPLGGSLDNQTTDYRPPTPEHPTEARKE